MDVDNDAPDPVIGAFEIGDQSCYGYFDGADEAFAWLIARQDDGLLRPIGVYQGAMVWKGENDFALPAPRLGGEGGDAD